MKNIDINPKTAEILETSLRELIVRLRAEQAQIENKIKEAENGLRALGVTLTNKPIKKSPRRKWGQNRQEIKAFLSDNSQMSFSSDTIAAKLNIPRSSTLSTLKKLEDDGFVEQREDGLWRKKHIATDE